MQRLNNVVVFVLKRDDINTHNRPAILLGDDEVVCNIHQASGKIAGVGGLDAVSARPLRAP